MPSLSYYWLVAIWLVFCTFVGGAIVLAVSPGINAAFLATSRPELLEFLKTDGTSSKPIAKSLVEVVNQCEMIHRALAMTILLVLLHMFFWLFIGTFIMYGINTMYADPEELASKGYSKL